ncbi:MAG: hypothetical protein J0H98_08250 [Solirubrobacterales bacterium]|nr:hypothetical protein [Solirubrobacterales bacterium]
MSVDNFPDAYEDLRRPFTAAAVRWKIQSSFEGGALCVAYIDARLVAGRLNKVCPGIWSAKFEPHQAGGLVCHLTIGEITRSDYGAAENRDQGVKLKGDFSDALKRAAVHFGVGESLYVVPKAYLREGNHLQPKRSGNGYLLTDQGQGELRNRYALWLKNGGEAAFGPTLDHGDIEQEVSPTEPAEILADLISRADFNSDQVDAIREWAKNGRGLDPAKVQKATNLLLAEEPEVLLERAGA